LVPASAVGPALVQASVAFVTLDLSYHGASGTRDTHGDTVPPYGGISRSLGPQLPLFDHLLSTLVFDLEEHGLLDDLAGDRNWGSRPHSE